MIIGVGQYTQRKVTSEQALLSPAQLIAKSAKAAIESSKISACDIDTISCVRLVFDTNAVNLNRPMSYQNLPYTVGKYCGTDNASSYYYNEGGGNSPLKIIAQIGEKISNGEVTTALVAGGEALHNQRTRAIKQAESGNKGPLFEDQIDENGPELELAPPGTINEAVNKTEYNHGLSLPINAYPLIANGLRGHYKQTATEHIQACAQIGAQFSKVAAQNQYSWFPRELSADEIAQVNQGNRWIGFPYPKYLNSIIMVNMAASIVMTSWENAQKLNIPRENCVFLHGAANVNEIWNLTERENYYSSRAIRENIAATLSHSSKNGIGVGDLDFIDLYSCFPCAVQIAADELALAHDDPRGLTVTGGLPYFGGPGNNYSMHAVAEIYAKVKKKPGSFGLTTGNGWYLTKHSSLVLSAEPSHGKWRPVNTIDMQKNIDSYAVATTDKPTGDAIVEAYTVCHAKDAVKNTIVIGKQISDGKRFVALAGLDGDDINYTIRDREFLQHKGTVKQVEWKNKIVSLFQPNF